ncbi:leucine-rich repeat serine/threonine-protein kinase 2 isoform X2 [Conger conger]|uniref:leucine-rich repeat serine/threonine-protein kinase 2 isoform X2 n=1 Tax=Conger conger TaxID=82655 RepID=UPI002A59FC35|nr:leucine-rich repeat serine/threonine-protein kinase 2 isoform X2 [Conger conger]
MVDKEELEVKLKKLVVRLKNIHERKQLGTLVQIIEDLLYLTHCDEWAIDLFEDKEVHSPLMVVLSSYIKSHDVQQVGWSLLCRLLEICPGTLEKLARPLSAGKDWEVLGIHKQIHNVLSEHSGQCKVITVGLRALTLLLKSDAIMLTFLEDDMDIFDLILGAMTSFSTNEEVQAYGCRSLQLLLDYVPDVHRVEFVERGDHSVVLSVARTFLGNENMVLQALKVLLPLAGPACNVEILVSGNERCYSVINQVMEAFPHHQPLQEVGCCLFHKFIVLERYYNILVLNGVHRMAATACLMYPENAQLQIAALSCLAALTETIVQNKSLAEEEEQEELSWMDACCTAMERHTADPQVQEAACLALNSLLVQEPRLRQRFADQDGRAPIHRQVMAVMLLHSDCLGLLQAAAETLGTLIDRDSKIPSLLLSNGLHINILEIMKKHSSSPLIAESLCRLLHKLFQRRTSSLDEVVMAMNEILRAMKIHNFLPKVQLEALRASLTFLSPDRRLREHGVSVADPDMADISLKVLKNQCVVEGAHTVFLQALNRFIDSPDIQDCGLRVLTALADCSGAVDLMCQQGAIDTVLHTLQMFPGERDIHYGGLSLLQYLIAKKNLSVMIVPVLASVIVDTLTQYREDREMQLKGFQVAWKLMDTCSDAALELERQAFDRELFLQLRDSLYELRTDPLHKAICLCLSKMAADSNIRYVMLEKACLDGDFIMAECLIDLGADINRKTKTESLIYQVCENGGPLELVDLLLTSGTHEQHLRSALTVSVHKGDSPVVSLLLGKLGLDLNNNSLCLGGFRLGNIEASWLMPLFSERRSPSLRRVNSKGGSLAKQVKSCQKRRACSQQRMTDTHSGYISEESDDSSLFSLDDSLVWNEDMASDGSASNSTGSDGLPRVTSPHCDMREELTGQLVNQQQQCRKHASAEGGNSDSEPNELRQQGCVRISPNQRGNNSLLLGSVENPSILSPTSLGGDRERIRLLDLSGNELDSLCCLMGEGLLQQHLEHLIRLELSQNNLVEIPSGLCESLRSLTRLDLHSNRLQSLPEGILHLPALSMLNVSRNCVGPLLSLDPTARCPSLRQLNLAFNHVTVFPDQLTHVLSKLEELSFEGNKITELYSPLCLPELKHLDVSKNNIEKISQDFLSGCVKLETFTASVNKLSKLSLLPSKITTLKLSHNTFTCIPDGIIQLPCLRSVDLRNNDIKVLPGPSAWASANLRELIFSNNRISVLDLSGPVCKWSRLEKLHLANNKLTEIPPQIGLLEDLTSLDVSRNAGLHSFPDEMGKLGRLWDLPLDELRLGLNLKLIGNKTKDIVRYLQQRLKKAVPYHRMKLIVVGNFASGKSTLVQQLMKMKLRAERPSVAIDVRDWAIRDRKNMVLNVWDFSGWEEYHSSHPHFMTQRALYLVVYDMSKGESEVDAMKPWLFNIKAAAPLSPVFLVGTHADVSEEHQVLACVTKIRAQLLNQQSFPVIRDHYMVTAHEESDSVSRLRKSIISEAASFKIQGQPVMGQLIPESYLELEKRVLIERTRVALQFPVLNQQNLLEIIQDNQLQLKESELPHAVHFLNEAGILLHFDDTALQLKGLYFINPQWLCGILSQILTLKCPGVPGQPKGIIYRSVVEKFLTESKCFPKTHIAQYFKLLEKFLIALPFQKDQLLIPSSLSDHKPVIELPHCEKSEMIVRLYEMPYFPMGFWPRQINHLLEVSSSLSFGDEKAHPPKMIYWRRGVYLSWSSEAYCLVESASLDNSAESFVRIIVPCSCKGRALLGQVVDHIDSVLEEWFPGLLTTDIHGEGGTLLKKWAMYSFGDDQDWSKMLLEDLFSQDLDYLLVNPQDPRSTIPISQICPDLVLSDQPASVILNREELEMEESNEYLLGDGGFGSVYRAVYRNEDCAVKIFNKHASKIYLHRLLRQELAVLGRLRHPSLVSLLAAGTYPHRLVMELAPRGSLDSLFEHENGSLHRKLQHRIALHVADGLRFLHSSLIIYRDLKPHNVLLFNLKTDSEVIAKITDYGIAQYCGSMGVRTSEGTPGFRAPEVARGNVIYNQQADVFSFGLLLYDLLTCGQRITDGMKFPSEFDEIAVRGKLPDPVKYYGCSPWPRLESLMRECLKENPHDRPLSRQVFDRLNSGELLCLMKEVKVCGVSSAECFAVSCESGQPLVWVGGGSSSQRRGCVASVGLGSGKPTSHEVDHRPVLCLATVRIPGDSFDWMVAGTQSGALIVISTLDPSKQHHLQCVTDAVTSLFYHSPPQHSKKKKYLLVGTADGVLAVYEDSVIRCEDGQPMKTVQIGNTNTPLMSLASSGHSLDRTTVWGGCGTQILSFTDHYDVWKSIDTKEKHMYPQQNRWSSEANISRLVVEQQVFLSRAGAQVVEVWDKKSERMSDLIDCTQILAHGNNRRPRKLTTERVQEAGASWASVKALLVQPNATLWIGTRGGHVILVELTTCQPLRVFRHLCQSVRSIAVAYVETLNPKNVVLLLGRRGRPPQDQDSSQCDDDSVLLMWNSALPVEVRDLLKHSEMRSEIANTMTASLYD